MVLWCCVLFAVCCVFVCVCLAGARRSNKCGLWKHTWFHRGCIGGFIPHTPSIGRCSEAHCFLAHVDHETMEGLMNAIVKIETSLSRKPCRYQKFCVLNLFVLYRVWRCSCVVARAASCGHRGVPPEKQPGDKPTGNRPRQQTSETVV